MRAPLSAEAEEFLSWLAVEHGRSANTLAAYRRDLVGYEAFLAARGRRAVDASSDDVEAYLAERRASGAAATTLARNLAAVRGLYRFGAEEGWAGRDPSADVHPPRRPGRLPKALEEAEVVRLLEAASGDDPLARRDRAVLELLYATGMRVGELVGLSLGDLHGERGLLRVVGKGDKERVVPVGSMAAAALDRWLEPAGRGAMAPARWARRGDAEAVFLNRRGGRLSRQGVWGLIRLRSRRAGLEGRVHPHVLRHSCATHMLARGADIRVVQELLGHASVATTQIYTKVSMAHLRRVYEEAHPRAGPGRAK